VRITPSHLYRMIIALSFYVLSINSKRAYVLLSNIKISIIIGTMMKFKTSCPTCGEPITLGRVIAAPHPWGIKCPHCKSKVKARDHTPLLISAFTILILWGILTVFLRIAHFITLWHFVVMWLLFTLLLEVSFSLWVVNRGLRKY